MQQIRQAPRLPLPANRKAVIDAMRFSSEPSVLSFLHTYDATPICDRKQIPLEAVALKAGVKIPELLGAIVLCFQSYQAQKVAIMAMAAHPQVLESTIANAGMPGGEADRRIMHTALGFLPSPKGASFNFNFTQPQPVASAKDDREEDTPPDVNDLFPVITDKQEKWQGMRNKLLQGTN
jgi:hypothetical protein